LVVVVVRSQLPHRPPPTPRSTQQGTQPVVMPSSTSLPDTKVVTRDDSKSAAVKGTSGTSLDDP
jgi:hypothetical protein